MKTGFEGQAGQISQANLVTNNTLPDLCTLHNSEKSCLPILYHFIVVHCMCCYYCIAAKVVTYAFVLSFFYAVVGCCDLTFCHPSYMFFNNHLDLFWIWHDFKLIGKKNHHKRLTSQPHLCNCFTVHLVMMPSKMQHL